MPLEPQERMARLALARSGAIGPVRFQELLRECGDARSALSQLPDLMRRARLKTSHVATLEQIQAEMTALDRLGGRLIVWGDDVYPAPLAEIHDPPPVISAQGRIELLGMPMVAIVGSRNASAGGRRFTETMARDLGEAGYAVVSGLARGIDAAAHGGAVDAGTVAVVAGGIDVVYPPKNKDLHHKIAEQGLIISDQPLGLVPRAGHFPRRNRIVAGLVLGVIVVEATERSGALITARLGAENGRDVFAVPGSPQDPRAKGPNRLIRDGAALVESAQDVIAALSQPLRSIPRFSREAEQELAFDAPLSPPPEDVDNAPQDTRERLVSALGTEPIEVDELVRRCQVTPAEAQILLLELELAGRIERHPGNKVALVSS
ncbi:MAG: DNA-processing protein DprA [Alphaproteobacteria bacterium]|jgi:DNA processing protein|nr:DNA-protecting protein DprA [Rhodospirillaceae bacterium]MBT6510032.1 DNA-protecting protein DprA [Rhodospirillaceae bacterium]MBT7646210.1 DNA-protecting protein DprA [Rhodospirillaceae bacterium]MDG2479705.1 DNA-processing protein DprA [Alphaproteobacteria bacterium]